MTFQAGFDAPRANVSDTQNLSGYTDDLYDTRDYAPLPTAGEIAERPTENTLFLNLALAHYLLREQYLANLRAGAGMYLRSWFSGRAAMLLPFEKYALRPGGKPDRSLPILLQAGGAFHPLQAGSFDLSIPLLAGFEINADPRAAYGSQAFMELGFGAQYFIGGMATLTVEYAYHISNIPQAGGRNLEHNYHRVDTGAGIFF